MKQSGNSIDCSFSISWTHRLRFTTNAFIEGDVLADVMNELQPLKLLVVIDSGIIDSNSVIMSSIEQWSSTVGFDCGTPIQVTGGEDAKNNCIVVDSVLEEINSRNLCRKSAVLVIGGGAVLDAVGYAASIAHRGIQLIRMPSTTLSQCDSGVGVKNGVNHFNKKNFTGVFDPPFAVINDLSLLETLDDRHWFSGLSEAVKVSLVKDCEFFELIESSVRELADRNLKTMSRIVKQSAILHFRHIVDGNDAFERLDARPLDFGHWAAHKLEQLSNYELTHGEAVSVGIAIDVKCSVLLGLLPQDIANRIISLLQKLGLPTTHPEMKNPLLYQGIEEFRQHLGGKLTLLMLKGVGEPICIHTLDSEIVRQAIDELL